MDPATDTPSERRRSSPMCPKTTAMELLQRVVLAFSHRV